MNCERLPPELVEEVFDYLCEDKRALKMCSLVCKAWFYPAYRRLLYDTHLTWDQLRVAFDSRSESTAARWIRRLSIGHGSSREWNENFPLLDGFRSITSLSLQTLSWSGILPEIRSTISDQFIAITRLELQEVYTNTFSELAQIICTFPCLESLILGSTYWRRSDKDKASPLLRLPSHLHALEFDGDNLTEILEWLCSFGQALTVRDVCFWCPWRHYQAINTFLRVLGPSLESFRLRFRGPAKYPIRLHHNPHLRFLHVHVWCDAESEIRLTHLLSGVNSVHMEEVSLSIIHFPILAISHDHISAEWRGVDAILAGQQFSSLDSVGVRHVRFNHNGADTQNLFEWFFDRLPLCHKRGVLRLYEGKMWRPLI